LGVSVLLGCDEVLPRRRARLWAAAEPGREGQVGLAQLRRATEPARWLPRQLRRWEAARFYSGCYKRYPGKQAGEGRLRRSQPPGRDATWAQAFAFSSWMLTGSSLASSQPARRLPGETCPVVVSSSPVLPWPRSRPARRGAVGRPAAPSTLRVPVVLLGVAPAPSASPSPSCRLVGDGQSIAAGCQTGTPGRARAARHLSEPVPGGRPARRRGLLSPLWI